MYMQSEPLMVQNWKALRKNYGTTKILVQDSVTTIAEWSRNIEAGREGLFTILSLNRSSAANTQLYLKWNAVQQGLADMTALELDEFWLRRRDFPKEVKGRIISKIWREYEIRYPGLTRKPIIIKLQYIRNCKALEIRGALRVLLDTKKECGQTIL